MGNMANHHKGQPQARWTGEEEQDDRYPSLRYRPYRVIQPMSPMQPQEPMQPRDPMKPQDPMPPYFPSMEL